MKELIENLGKSLDRYIRFQTFPLAIKMLESEEIPANMRRPAVIFGNKVAICQAIGIARKYGWSIALTKDDIICAPGYVVLGFGEPTEYYLEGNICVDMYTETKEAGEKSEEEVFRFEHGKYKAILIAPLHRTDFDPDIIVIYGNSAQIARLIHASLYKMGGRLHTTTSGRLDCSEIIVQTMQTKECQVVVPCYGDRIFGLTSDYEMVFTIPKEKITEIIEGLEGTHKVGTRYPIPQFYRFQPVFPESYNKLGRDLGIE